MEWNGSPSDLPCTNNFPCEMDYVRCAFYQRKGLKIYLSGISSLKKLFQQKSGHSLLSCFLGFPLLLNVGLKIVFCLHKVLLL